MKALPSAAAVSSCLAGGRSLAGTEVQLMSILEGTVTGSAHPTSVPSVSLSPPPSPPVCHVTEFNDVDVNKLCTNPMTHTDDSTKAE